MYAFTENGSDFGQPLFYRTNHIIEALAMTLYMRVLFKYDITNYETGCIVTCITVKVCSEYCRVWAGFLIPKALQSGYVTAVYKL